MGYEYARPRIPFTKGKEEKRRKGRGRKRIRKRGRRNKVFQVMRNIMLVHGFQLKRKKTKKK